MHLNPDCDDFKIIIVDLDDTHNFLVKHSYILGHLHGAIVRVTVVPEHAAFLWCCLCRVAKPFLVILESLPQPANKPDYSTTRIYVEMKEHPISLIYGDMPAWRYAGLNANGGMTA